MIKFFRKIRQKLLNENKFSKYLIYAIGEIVLVVIGILIALQVNNGNEFRKAQNDIRKSAKSLINDLEKDLVMTGIISSQANVFGLRLDSLVVYLHNKNVSEVANLDVYCLSHGMMYRPYTWHRMTIESLINSNGLGNIKNDSLSQKIVEYHSFTKHLDEDYQQDYSLSEKVGDFRSQIINKNYANIKALSDVLRSYNDQAGYSGVKPFSFYRTTAYNTAFIEDLKLITQNPDEIKVFANYILDMKGSLSIRKDIELPILRKKTLELIELLKLEYN